MKGFFIALLIGVCLWVIGTVVVKSIHLKQDCTGYLQRAANANTVETAQVELKTAIDYLEANNLTTGYTSAWYRTPDEDIAFWYNNIKASHAELLSLPEQASPLEKSNMLMKLGETLLDSSESGSYVTMPGGLSRYPDNLEWGISLFIACLSLVVLITWGVVEFENS